MMISQAITTESNHKDLQAINYGREPENQTQKKIKENIFVGKKNVVYSFGRCSFPPTCCLGDTCNAKSGEKPTNIVSWPELVCAVCTKQTKSCQGFSPLLNMQWRPN